MNMSNSSDFRGLETWEENLRLDGLMAQLSAYGSSSPLSYVQYIQNDILMQKRMKAKIRRGAKAKMRISAKAERAQLDPWSLPLPSSLPPADPNKPHTKLRLLVTDKCHNSCPMCCNKQYNLKDLPVVDKWDYDEIMITGGEPLMANKGAHQLISLLDSIRSVWKAMGHTGVIYLYTASHRVDLIVKVLKYVDGIVYTPHNLQEFNVLKCLLGNYRYMHYEKRRSLRLNIFKDQVDMLSILPSSLRIRLNTFWTIKEIEWVPECPVPTGEDFRRIQAMY